MSNKNIIWKGITLTDSAVQYILQLISKNPKILGLKVTIRKSGCAGFSYKLDEIFFPEKENIIYERNGAKLFIPINMMHFIDGTELDYVQAELSSFFKFNNPQVRSSCGCGESFNI